jgi:hypothetical protein
MHKHARRGWFRIQPKLGEGVGCLIVSLEDMVELEAIEFHLQLPNLLPIHSHAGVTTV